MGAHTATRRAPRFGRVARTGLVSAAAATTLVGAGTGVASASTVVVDGSSTTTHSSVSASGFPGSMPATAAPSVSTCTTDGVLDPLRPGFADAVACLTRGDAAESSSTGSSTDTPSTDSPSTDTPSTGEPTTKPSGAPTSSTSPAPASPAPTSQTISPSSSDDGTTSGIDTPPPPGRVESYRIP